MEELGREPGSSSSMARHLNHCGLLLQKDNQEGDKLYTGGTESGWFQLFSSVISHSVPNPGDQTTARASFLRNVHCSFIQNRKSVNELICHQQRIRAMRDGACPQWSTPQPLLTPGLKKESRTGEGTCPRSYCVFLWLPT